ncbi:MAG: hypothetical protein DRO96_01160 [Candidatus Aenigmatarchaeota archaeon]|nr:MAG: hypothetical protein DRO96_01160 [Candidatus Aenigmarchaeota archaeon]
MKLLLEGKLLVYFTELMRKDPDNLLLELAQVYEHPHSIYSFIISIDSKKIQKRYPDLIGDADKLINAYIRDIKKELDRIIKKSQKQPIY